MPAVFSAMRRAGLRRILVLSTPSGYKPEGETLSWSWTFLAVIMPRAAAPQGDAEMRGIAEVTVRQDDLDWTVYRIPHLNELEDDKEVVVGLINSEYRGTTELSRLSLAKWILKELEEKRWIKQAPMVSNP